MKLFFIVMLVAGTATAKIKIETVDYKSGETTLQGALVYDDSKGKGKRPGVVVVHDWMGMGSYVQSRAEQIAGMGYVAFIADIYGKGVRPDSPKEAQVESSKYKNNRKEMRARANAAYETLKANPLVNAEKVSAIGYCFGGMVALEMARAGLPLAGAISVHGTLQSESPADAAKIKAKVLVLHGAIDPHVSEEEVAGFQREMNAAKANYEFVAYSGAVHAFTKKEAGNDISKGGAYNEQADRRSAVAIQNFLSEVSK